MQVAPGREIISDELTFHLQKKTQRLAASRRGKWFELRLMFFHQIGIFCYLS